MYNLCQMSIGISRFNLFIAPKIYYIGRYMKHLKHSKKKTNHCIQNTILSGDVVSA